MASVALLIRRDRAGAFVIDPSQRTTFVDLAIRVPMIVCAAIGLKKKKKLKFFIDIKGLFVGRLYVFLEYANVSISKFH